MLISEAGQPLGRYRGIPCPGESLCQVQAQVAVELFAMEPRARPAFGWHSILQALVGTSFRSLGQHIADDSQLAGRHRGVGKCKGIGSGSSEEARSEFPEKEDLLLESPAELPAQLRHGQGIDSRKVFRAPLGGNFWSHSTIYSRQSPIAEYRSFIWTGLVNTLSIPAFRQSSIISRRA